MKPILCLDFDGVCHSYTSGWQGADVIPDPPVDGLFEFLEAASEVFDIVIFSSRSKPNSLGGPLDGIIAMQTWFGRYYSEYIFAKNPELKKTFLDFTCPLVRFVTEKPPAFVTIDDRAITFAGHWPTIEELKNFQPWYRERNK